MRLLLALLLGLRWMGAVASLSAPDNSSSFAASTTDIITRNKLAEYRSVAYFVNWVSLYFASLH